MQTTLTCNLCRNDGPFTVLVAAGAAAASNAGAASEAAAADADADVIGATLGGAGAATSRVRDEVESWETPAHSKILSTFRCSLAIKLPPKA